MRTTLAAAALFLASGVPGRLWAAGHFGFIVQLPGATRVVGIERDPKGDWIVAGNTNSDLFVAKYSRAGESLWSVRLGGPNWEDLTAFALDPAGDVYLLGTTGSPDFPVPASTGRFLLKLAGPNGLTLASYPLPFVSLYGLAIDPEGRPWIAAGDNFVKFAIVPKIARLDPASGVVELVVIPPIIVTRIAFDGDGTAWLLASDRLFRMDGAALTTVSFTSPRPPFFQVLRAAGNRVCAAGSESLAPIAGCVDARTGEAVWSWEPPSNGARVADLAASLDIDPDGGIWVGGATGNPAFPTRATLQGAFHPVSGFLTHLGADGALAESTFVGDWRSFLVTGIAASRERVVFVGNTATAEAFLVEVVRDETPAVRIDSVSLEDRRVALLGEFGESTAVTFDGEPGALLDQSPGRLVVLLPDRPFPAGLTVVQVESGGIRSNSVLLSTLR